MDLDILSLSGEMQRLPRQKVIADRFSQLLTRVEAARAALRDQGKRGEAEEILCDLRERQKSLQVRARESCVFSSRLRSVGGKGDWDLGSCEGGMGSRRVRTAQGRKQIRNVR